MHVKKVAGSISRNSKTKKTKKTTEKQQRHGNAMILQVANGGSAALHFAKSPWTVHL